MVVLNKAVFLDRDGVINKVILKDGIPFAPTNIEDVEILDGVISALDDLRNAQYKIIVVTNQPDVSRRKIDAKKIHEINNYIAKLTQLTNFYVCTHDDNDFCTCRKPKPGLIKSAAKDLDINLGESVLVGDRWKDISAGQEAGCKCFFINNNYREVKPKLPYFEVKSLAEAAKIIIGDK
jgi:D-glycero-D-manno-heptose 1,7-bisphosphate phosphatase